MLERHTSGVAAGPVMLFEDMQRPAEHIVAALAVGDRLLSDLGQSVGTIEHLAQAFRLDGEELGRPRRNAVPDTLERADRRIHLVRFDQRDRRIGDAGVFSQFPLRQLVAEADEAKSPAECGKA